MVKMVTTDNFRPLNNQSSGSIKSTEYIIDIGKWPRKDFSVLPVWCILLTNPLVVFHPDHIQLLACGHRVYWFHAFQMMLMWYANDQTESHMPSHASVMTLYTNQKESSFSPIIASQ